MISNTYAVTQFEFLHRQCEMIKLNEDEVEIIRRVEVSDSSSVQVKNNQDHRLVIYMKKLFIVDTRL